MHVWIDDERGHRKDDASKEKDQVYVELGRNLIGNNQEVPGTSRTSDADGWNRGVILGSSQNLARTLMEAPANFLTPTQFCAEAEREMSGLPVTLTVRDQAWAEQMKMGSFLSVARGSAEPPKFLEMKYVNGGDSDPVILVGKGVTFDTGGISIKPSAKASSTLLYKEICFSFGVILLKIH